jgi:hypothetical protein
MKMGWRRATTLWTTDKVLLIVGVTLVAASPLWWPWLLPLGWAALGLGLLAWLGESTGYERPRESGVSDPAAGPPTRGTRAPTCPPAGTGGRGQVSDWRFAMPPSGKQPF